MALKGASLSEGFKGASRGLQQASRGLERSVKPSEGEGGFEGGLKGASRGLEGGFKGASRGLHLRKA